MNRSIFQFSNPRIITSSFVTNRSIEGYDGKHYATELEGQVDLQEDSENEKEAVVLLTVIINKDEEYIKEKCMPFYCKVTCAAKFSWTKEMSKEELEPFFQVNAPSLLLSYVRTHVSFLTTQAGFPAFHIPFINFKHKDME